MPGITKFCSQDPERRQPAGAGAGGGTAAAAPPHPCHHQHGGQGQHGVPHQAGAQQPAQLRPARPGPGHQAGRGGDTDLQVGHHQISFPLTHK